MTGPSPICSSKVTGTDCGRDWYRLIETIKQGDEEAFCRLYEASAGRVYGLALRITGNPANAEEVVEDVYHEVWRTASSFDADRGHPLVWLMMLTRGRAISKWRSSRSPVTLEKLDEFMEDFPCLEEHGPEQKCLHGERTRLLAEAMKLLSAKENQLLSLAFLFSMSHSEIASQMQMPLGTVKSCVRRALMKLRDSLESHEMRG